MAEELPMMYISGVKERCMILGAYIIENQSTVRAAAAHFGISKSTVHKDVTQALKRSNKSIRVNYIKLYTKCAFCPLRASHQGKPSRAPQSAELPAARNAFPAELAREREPPLALCDERR